MKIILLADVRNFGKKYEVKEVSDGYARNFLFPNQLAEPANVTSLKKLETMKAELDKNEAELKKHHEAIARKINETSIQFDLKKGKDGSVFGSVNKESVLKALREHKIIAAERVDITLDHPIKLPGNYVVPIDLKKGITAELKVIVVAEEGGK